MDEQPAGARGDDPAPATAEAGPSAAPDAGEVPPSAADAREDATAPGPEGGRSEVDEIVDLPWDEALPVALGEETEASEELGGSGAGRVEAYDDLDDDPRLAPRRNALPRRVESWRNRSASGAIATAIAMGLQQVFEPEKRRPAAVAEAPSDPYSDDDPITVDYVPDDAEGTTVHVKPWLLQKGDPA